jgi:hypothetical protein
MRKKLTSDFHNPVDRGHCSWAVDGRKHKMACTFSDEKRKTYKNKQIY